AAAPRRAEPLGRPGVRAVAADRRCPGRLVPGTQRGALRLGRGGRRRRRAAALPPPPPRSRRPPARLVPRPAPSSPRVMPDVHIRQSQLRDALTPAPEPSPLNRRP